jgi:ribosomal protein L11 methyltransferase
MAWLSATLIIDAAHAEALADALTDAGALSATIEDADAGTADEKPQFGEPGADIRIGWERSKLAVLFAEDADVSALINDAIAAIGLASTPPCEIERVEEQDWVSLTQSQFDPIRVSERLWIVPSWHEAPDDKAINIVLDPGLAFGTGSHPTTRLCLEWLEREVTPGCSVLDVGCGSGVLAIAAAKLGAGEIVGTDIDPQAVTSARSNAAINRVAMRVENAAGFRPGEYDLVVANILANPLKTLAPALCAHVRPGGGLALAGLLVEQAEELIAIYAPWIRLEIADQRDGWACLAGRRNATEDAG